ncbi:MAG: serine hydrolase [Rhizomicrobium sp.]|jgi:CubicO group peptidase (beta-lactamase class C family)
MNRITGLLAGIALLASTNFAVADTAPPPPKNIQDLDRQLAAIFVKDKIPGASFALIENGKVTFARGYGYADVARKIPATADTPFRAGSISKAITSIAVMTLVEQHKLSLDAPIASLVPEVHFVNPWEATNPVRLVNLLEHTTGWPDISTRVLARDEKTWSNMQGVQFVSSEFVSRWKPGYFTVYDNAGPPVAALAVEKATGKDFDAYARDAVLRPMGMATADFDLPPDLAARIAKSYAPDGTITAYQYIVLKPAGSLNVSARELAQLAVFYIGRGTVDGRRILSPESVARIERGESNLGAKFGFAAAYGLGNVALPDTGITFRGHNGQIDSFSSVLGYTLRNNSGYVLMANGGQGVDFAQPAAHLIQTYLTRGLPLDPKPTVKVSQAELDKYAGFYRTITPPNDLLRPYVEALIITHVTAGPGKLVVNGNDWFPVGPHSFRRFDREDASLAFVEDGGNVYKIGAFNAQVKEPLWMLVAIWSIAALLVLGAATGIASLIVWIVARLRGRLATFGGLAMRLLPLAGIAALVANFIMPLMAISGSGTSAIHQLADVGPYSLTIFACSLLYPLCGALGLVLAYRRSDTRRFIRAYVGLTSFALICVTFYAIAIGWFAMRTWTM